MLHFAHRQPDTAMSKPKKKPAARKAKPAKKPAARQIPPPPPGWEIVGKDDPRLDCLPVIPMWLNVKEPKKGWQRSWRLPGDSATLFDRTTGLYALPIATQSAQPQPPMIRLRLPSEKPTREDGDKNGNIFAIHRTVDAVNLAATYRWDRPFDGDEIAWFSLPEGILPREPSQEEKWRAEFEGLMHRSFAMGLNSDGDYAYPATKAAWQGFLAAKKGGAE